MSSNSEVTYRRYDPSERRNGRRWDQSRTDRTGRHPAGRSTTYGLLKSTSGVPCRTEFVNRTDVTLRVLWLDFQGQKMEYSVMPPGGSYRGLMTYTTHPWVLEDQNGTVYAVYVGGSATVTVHGRDSFTVVSGVQGRSRATQDSIRARVIEKLRQSCVAEKMGDVSVNDTDLKRADEVDGQDSDTKEPLTNSSSKQAMPKGIRGLLGWCVPTAKELKDGSDEGIPDRKSVMSEAEKGVQGCSICCEALEQDLWALACGHVFHGPCLASACEHQLECPICRQEISGEMDLQRVYLS